MCFDRNYRNFLTCLRIGVQRSFVRFVDIRPKQRRQRIRRSIRCTGRRAEVSNRPRCLRKTEKQTRVK